MTKPRQGNPPPASDLLQLLEEMTEAKRAVQDVLAHAPEDIQLHRIHGMYTGHILDIRKAILQEQAVDKDQLLLDALNGIVNFLFAQGEVGPAQLIGEHLEEIGNQVKLTWQDTKPFPGWPTATTKSAKPSRNKASPSKKPPTKKKTTAKAAR